MKSTLVLIFCFCLLACQPEKENSSDNLNVSEKTEVMESLIKSNGLIAEENLDNFGQFESYYKENSEKLDSSYKQLTSLRQKVNSLCEILKSNSPENEFAQDSLGSFMTLVNQFSIPNDLPKELEYKPLYSDELSKLILVNTLLRTENSIQKQILSDISIHDMRMVEGKEK